jgi:hypothetical protein
METKRLVVSFWYYYPILKELPIVTEPSKQQNQDLKWII